MRLRNDRFRPSLESLETRDLMAGSLQVTLVNGYLYVQGSNANDAISVNQSGGQLSVAGAQIVAGSARFNSVAASSVRAIAAYGYGGNDTISVSAAVTTPSYLYGGDGNDQLYGGSGSDYL